jgi:hypothetical protein
MKMNKFIASLIILNSLAGVSFAQEYKKLVVSEIKHHILSNVDYDVNKLSFPCYFNDSIFLEDIKDTISFYVKRKFAIDTVIFPDNPITECDEMQYAQKTLPVLPDNPGIDNLYMGIYTSISYRIIEFQEVFYQLNTHIYIVDGKNKKRMKKFITLPFMVKLSEGIMSDTLMHRMDFEIFYLDALSSAFRDGPVLLDKRFVYQTLTERYDNFLENASDYLIERGDSIYSLGKEDTEAIPVLSLKPLAVAEERDSTLNKCKSISEYQVTHLNTQDNNDIILCTNELDQVELSVRGGMNSGEFLYDRSGILSGKLNKDSVNIQWNPSSSISEVRINRELVGIIHYRPDGQYLYYKYGNSPNSLAKIAFLVFLYDEAEFAYQKSTKPTWEYDSSLEGSSDLLF